MARQKTRGQLIEQYNRIVNNIGESNSQRTLRVKRAIDRYTANIRKTKQHQEAVRNFEQGSGTWKDVNNNYYSRSTYMGLAQG